METTPGTDHNAPRKLSESFISSLRYARHSPRIKTILFRDQISAVVISIVPALLPVVSLKELHLSATHLGLVFTCVGVGSLVGAIVLLPYLRQRISPNAITSLSMAILVAVLLAFALVRELPVLLAGATFAGVGWALAGSELWVAGWVRGRMNAFQIMLGQGSMALGAFFWGAGIAHAGADWTFATAAIVALIALVLGRLFSINFPADASLDAAPLNPLHDFPVVPHMRPGRSLSPSSTSSKTIVAMSFDSSWWRFRRHARATVCFTGGSMGAIHLHGYGLCGRTFADTARHSHPLAAGKSAPRA